MYFKKIVCILLCSFVTAMLLCMLQEYRKPVKSVNSITDCVEVTRVSSDVRTVDCYKVIPQFCIGINNTQLDTLMKIVEAEAGGEDYIGKVLVANVVINRVKSEDFPDDVDKVIYQHDEEIYQFSPVLDGRISKVEISEETRKAVYDALCGHDYSNGALYFVAKNAKEEKKKWFVTNLQYLYTHGGHEFYL